MRDTVHTLPHSAMTFEEASEIVSEKLFLRVILPDFVFRLPSQRLQTVGRAFTVFSDTIYRVIRSRDPADGSASQAHKHDLLSLLLKANRQAQVPPTPGHVAKSHAASTDAPVPLGAWPFGSLTFSCASICPDARAAACVPGRPCGPVSAHFAAPCCCATALIPRASLSPFPFPFLSYAPAPTPACPAPPGKNNYPPSDGLRRTRR